jgi:hypothetical protein
VVEVGDTDVLSLNALLPDHPPEAVQVVGSLESFVALQVSVEDCPDWMLVGFAVSVTVGGGGFLFLTVTVALADPEPPGPVQDRV